MIDRSKALVHERDGLLTKVAELERRLTELGSKHRHWMSLSCDRCKTSLTISTATAIPEVEIRHALAQSAIALRWTLSANTADGLLCPGAANHVATDACPACSAIIESAFTLP